MSELTLGIDLSDVIARIAVVDGAGKIVERGMVAPYRDAAIKDAVKKALHGAAGKVSAIGVALPAAGESIAADMAATLTGATSTSASLRTIAAGTAAALAEHRMG